MNRHDSFQNHILPIKKRETFPFYLICTSHLSQILETLPTMFQKIFHPSPFTFYTFRKQHYFILVEPTVVIDISLLKIIRHILIEWKQLSPDIFPLSNYTYNEPPILFPYRWDISKQKWNVLSYTCISHEINTISFLTTLSEYKKQPKTSLKDEFQELIKGKDIDTDIEPLHIDIKNIPISHEEIIGTYISKDIYIQIMSFHLKFHPDAKLRNLKLHPQYSNLILFDFTKSKRTCKICKRIHRSNRQYIIHNIDTKNTYYHCYDEDATSISKKIILSSSPP